MIFQPSIDTIESVLAIRATAIASLASGGTTVSWSVGDASASKQVTMSAKTVIEEANEFLRAVLPDVYGPRVKRTIPMFR